MFIFNMILWLVGLFILYLVISAAVKDGINKSLVGKMVKEKFELKDDDGKPFLDNDLDNGK